MIKNERSCRDIILQQMKLRRCQTEQNLWSFDRELLRKLRYRYVPFEILHRVRLTIRHRILIITKYHLTIFNGEKNGIVIFLRPSISDVDAILSPGANKNAFELVFFFFSFNLNSTQTAFFNLIQSFPIVEVKHCRSNISIDFNSSLIIHSKKKNVPLKRR